MQVLADAKAVDDAAKAGKDVMPLCGLAFAIKDNLDVLGCALLGMDISSYLCSHALQW